MKPKRLLKATDKFEFPSSGKVYSIWSYGDKHSFDKAEPKGEPQRTRPDLFCPETSRHDCSLSQYLGMKGGRSPNTPSHPSLLSSPRSLSFSTLTLVQGMQYMIFFPPVCLWVHSHRPQPAPTSSMRMIKVALCPCSATRRPSVVTTWRPLGAFPGHIWALAVYFSLSPSVQLLDTIRRYLRSIDSC